MDGQRRSLAAFTAAGDAAGRLSELADTPPDRVGEAVRDALLSADTDTGGVDTGGRPGDGEDAAHLRALVVIRADWQEKLLALGPAGSQFPVWRRGDGRT